MLAAICSRARNRFAHLPHNRGAFTGGRQRFTVDPHNGGSRITLTEDEKVSVSTNEDGSVVIDVGPVEEDNGNGLQASARRWTHRAARQRMNVIGNTDGSVTISPEPGNELLVTGDPELGAVEVVEVRPAEPVE
ncbi:MAG TPA: hypothetical protein VNA86_09260 [bacterium]|jgi:hypothetical protein|nr:hypothetical protein [bacterium]